MPIHYSKSLPPLQGFLYYFSGFFALRELSEGLACGAVGGPVGHGAGVEAEIEVDAWPVPVEAGPFEPAAAALEGEGSEFSEQRPAVTFCTISGFRLEAVF